MQNPERKIILLNSQKDFSAQSLAKEIESYFIADHPELMEVLALFAMNGLPEFLQKVEEFFIVRININNLSREQIENLDYKKLAYEFAKELKIERPLFPNDEIRQKVILVYCKIARIFIHEILFPEIVKIDPKLARSVQGQLKRAIGSVAVIEGFNKHDAYELLRIDDLNLDLQTSFLPPAPDKVVVNQDVYFKTILTEGNLNNLGNELKTNYQIIISKTEFAELFSKDGTAKKPLRVYREKIKYFVCLIDLMYHSENKKLIFLNKTKGYWKILQYSVVDENENFYDYELNRICSALRKSTKNDDKLIQEEMKKLISKYQIK